jgi:glycosyltransferase involved in cell wall biosynthesis
MHLCLVCCEYPPAHHGGIGSASYDLAEGLVAAGHKVTVVGIYSNSQLEYASTVNQKNSEINLDSMVRIVRLPETAGTHFWHQRALWDRWRLKRCISQMHTSEHFDILEYPDNNGWLPWGGPRNLPSVVRTHGTFYGCDRALGCLNDPFCYRLEEKTLKSANYWLGVSQSALDRNLSFCGVETWPSDIIYNAVDSQLFAPRSVPIEEGLIVFVNSIGPCKGVPELMEAANIFFPQYPHAHLVLIGGNAGKTRNGQTYAAQMKSKLHPEIAARVVFTGPLVRNEILPYLQKAQVCCFPSHSETFGISPVEAMACGKPTIYSYCGPGPEVIQDGVSGLLCNPKDPSDIAAKLVHLLCDHEMANRLGQAARQRVLERFSRSEWIPRNIAFYDKCIREFQAPKRPQQPVNIQSTQ